MNRIGITGGIGAGKSASADLLRRSGFPLLDTDEVAREVVAPGSEGLEAVVDAFGSGVLQPDGTLDRRRLGAWVFQDAVARVLLETILHPRIHAIWSSWLSHPTQAESPVAFVVIPLLFEKGYEAGFDSIASVGCTPSTQRRRLLARGWSEDELSARLRAQLPMEEKLRRSTHVVWNEGDLDCLGDQWRRLVAAWGGDGSSARDR